MILRVPWNQVPGTFTPWQPLPEPTDILFYEGLHGGVVTPQHDVARHVDLLVGVVPIINLEWIQKMIRDTSERGHSRETVMDSVVRSMDDYINFITPQFSRTHINFQRVPTVDTSNPFAAKNIPSLDESFVVIHFRDLEGIDYPWLLAMLQGSSGAVVTIFDKGLLQQAKVVGVRTKVADMPPGIARLADRHIHLRTGIAVEAIALHLGGA